MEKKSVSREEMQRLAEKVAAEVKRRLNEEVCSQTAAMAQGARDGIQKKRLLVIGSLKEEECTALSGSYELVWESEELWQRGREGGKKQCCDTILVAGLSFRAMAEVVHGISGSSQSAGILQGLMTGCPVFLLERGLEYRNYKDSASRTLYLFYQKQEELLKQFGIRFVEHILDILDWTKPRSVGETPKAADLTHLTLLQESDLIRARNMGCRTIRIKEHAKVTPLAMDYMKNHGLTFFRE